MNPDAVRGVDHSGEGRLCPFGVYDCMCSFCEDPCNDGLNCSDCHHAGRACHHVYLCTGFSGDFDAYLDAWRAKEMEKIKDA